MAWLPAEPSARRRKIVDMTWNAWKRPPDIPKTLIIVPMARGPKNHPKLANGNPPNTAPLKPIFQHNAFKVVGLWVSGVLFPGGSRGGPPGDPRAPRYLPTTQLDPSTHRLPCLPFGQLNNYLIIQHLAPRPKIETWSSLEITVFPSDQAWK